MRIDTIDDLTDTERRILYFIRRYFEEYRIPPSVRDLMCEETGVVSTSHAAWLRDKLAALGYIEVVPNVARGIILTHKGEVY